MAPLEGLRKALEASVQELADILETVPLPVVIADENGTVVRANGAVLGALGWDPRDLVGQDLAVLATEPAATRHGEYVRHYLETGRASTPEGLVMGRVREVRVRRKDGSEFPADLRVREMAGADGRRLFLGVLVDLSERKTAEERLLQAQKSEALGTMLAGVAHDLNNVLMALGGSLECAASSPPGEAGAWIAKAGRARDRATALVRHLLQFARHVPFTPMRLDPGRLVRETTDLARQTLDPGIALVVEVEPGLAGVTGDPVQLQQVLWNLLANARDAVEGMAGPRIEVRARETESVVGISVRDNGTGMPDAVRERVFDPFFTTKPPGRGTGLSLATSFGIVARHGGSLEVESREGEGSVFTVRLPVAEGGPAEERPSQAPMEPCTVLVVDDDLLVLDVTRTYLERSGLRALTAPDGREALRLFERETVDAVVLDVSMPGLDGWEVLARLRSLREVPVLMASGYALEAEARRRGAAGLLLKPFSSRALLEALRSVLPGRECRPEAQG